VSGTGAQTGGWKPSIQPGSSLSPHTGHCSSTSTPGDFSLITMPEPGMIIGRTSPLSARNCVVCRHPWHTVRAGGTSLVTRPI
jgi:hypothetical protein